MSVSYEKLNEYILEYETKAHLKHEILEKNAVGYIHPKSDELYKTYVVDDRREYAVEVDTDDFHESVCECDMYNKIRMCNHIISTLLYIYEAEHAQEEEKILINSDIEKKIIGLVENKYVEYKTLNIRPKLYINKIDNIINIEIVASIVGSREYVIKDPVDFLQKVYNGEYFKSNKSFELFENSYVLNSNSQKLVDILNDNIFQNEKKFYIKSSEIEISALELREIISIYKENDIIEINYNEYVKKELPILEMKINALYEDNKMIFTIDKSVSIDYLASDDILLIGDNIYPLKSLEKKVIKIFKPLLSGQISKIEMTNNYFDFFVLNIKELLSGIFDISYDKEYNQEIIDVNLTCNLKIEKENNAINITPIFSYAGIEYTFDGMKKSSKIAIVNRDIDTEKEILSYFKTGKFKRIASNEEKYGYYQTNDYKIIHNLFKMIIPTLEEMGNVTVTSEVEYDDIFKRLSMNDYNVSLSQDSEMDGMFKFDFDFKYLDEDDIENLMKSINDFDGFYITAKKQIIQIDAELEERIRLVSYILDQIRNSEGLIPLYHLFFLKNESERLFKNINISKLLEDYIEQKNNYENIEIENSHATLRDYQKSGVRWMQQLNDFKFGGILADDMGLGKTIQAITFLNCNKPKSVLIIAPKSLLYNWYEEIKKFGDDFTCTIIEGTKEKRFELINDSSTIKITSYQSVRNDLEAYEDKIFEYMIMDEAQFIKNPSAKVSKAIGKLKAKTKFALTGTPVENNLIDLWSVFSNVMPGFLLTQKSFEKKYLSNDKNIDILKRHIKPFMLRRLKKDVLSELPDKIETPIYCDMNSSQKSLYKEYSSKYYNEIDGYVKENKIGNKKISILADLVRLRQISIFPGLFIDDYEESTPKIEAILDTIYESIENNNKVVVFSQFTKMLKHLRIKLENNHDVMYIDGKIDSKERLKLVNEFNIGETKIILVSLKAGGVGLNLTGANTVIHTDPWWNPAVENQATDRVHRIGQKEVVQVFKFITKGTIEEKIFLLKQKKENLLSEVVSTDLKLFSEMTDDEIQDLFEYKLD